jgi:hypothetical protein
MFIVQCIIAISHEKQRIQHIDPAQHNFFNC